MKDTGEPSADTSGIQIVEVRILNFRCLRKVNLHLGKQTVLIGTNNAGKTAFLDALHSAIGAGQRRLLQEDIHRKSAESTPPKTRSAVVDVLIRPASQDGSTVDSFPEGSPWVELWGNGIQQDEDGDDFVAIRTQTAWSKIHAEYRTQRRFLKVWGSDAETVRPEDVGDIVPAAQLEPFALHYLEAARDITGDMAGRTSLWSRLVSEPGLSDRTTKSIERRLSGINKQVLAESDVLFHVQSHLKCLGETVGCDPESVTITPLSRRLADMKKGMDVLIASVNGPPLPVARQGMGTRSAATILTLRAFMLWKKKTAGDDAMHSFIAVEEPETHLQPQAQRSVMRQLSETPGQRIVTTHSSYIAAEAPISEFRYFRKNGNETTVNTLNTDDLDKEQLRKINRQVLHTRGELLFAKGVVLFEGETEEQAIPLFAEALFKVPVAYTGISFIGVGGSGAYLPWVRLANRFSIPWYIFSDGEPETLNHVHAAFEAERIAAHDRQSRLFTIPDGKDFEAYLAFEPIYQKLIIEAICDVQATNDEHRRALDRKWKSAEDPAKDLANELRRKKTMYGALIASAIVARSPPVDPPPVLRNLLMRVAQDLVIPLPPENIDQ